MPRASPRKRTEVNYNEDEPSAKSVASKAAAKVKNVVAKAAPKRKVEDVKEEDQTVVAEKTNGTAKVVKKRKTKAEKEEDAMPLAPRTVVTTLQKGVHIGAHVSAAGGM